MSRPDNSFPAERDLPFRDKRGIQYEFPRCGYLSKIADYFVGIPKIRFKHHPQHLQFDLNSKFCDSTDFIDSSIRRLGRLAEESRGEKPYFLPARNNLFLISQGFPEIFQKLSRCNDFHVRLNIDIFADEMFFIPSDKKISVSVHRSSKNRRVIRINYS